MRKRRRLRPGPQSGSSSIALPARCCTLTPAARGQGLEHGHRWLERGGSPRRSVSSLGENGMGKKLIYGQRSPFVRVLSVTSAQPDPPLQQAYFGSVCNEEPQLPPPHHSQVSPIVSRGHETESLCGTSLGCWCCCCCGCSSTTGSLQRCAHVRRRYRCRWRGFCTPQCNAVHGVKYKIKIWI